MLPLHKGRRCWRWLSGAEESSLGAQINLTSPGKAWLARKSPSQLFVLAGWGGDREAASPKSSRIKWFKNNSSAKPGTQLNAKSKSWRKKCHSLQHWLGEIRILPGQSCFSKQASRNHQSEGQQFSVSSSPPHQTTEQKTLWRLFFLLFLAKDRAKHFNCCNKNPSERQGVKG